MPNPNVGLAAAATECDPGYYLKDGVCTDCGQKYYCPGDDLRYNCLDVNPAPNQRAYTVIDGVWSHPNAFSVDHCVCDWDYEDETRTWYQQEQRCVLGPGGPEYTRYYSCRPGYYASHYLWNNWYDQCAPCTNGPEHAHYTSYSTPSVMGAVESNCPWECDAGYYQMGDGCVPLCAAAGALYAGDYSAPLFPVRHTTPSLAIGIGGTVCYGALTPGAGDGINIRVAGTTYHMGGGIK